MVLLTDYTYTLIFSANVSTIIILLVLHFELFLVDFILCSTDERISSSLRSMSLTFCYYEFWPDILNLMFADFFTEFRRKPYRIFRFVNLGTRFSTTLYFIRLNSFVAVFIQFYKIKTNSMYSKFYLLN